MLQITSTQAIIKFLEVGMQNELSSEFKTWAICCIWGWNPRSYTGIIAKSFGSRHGPTSVIFTTSCQVFLSLLKFVLSEHSPPTLEVWTNLWVGWTNSSVEPTPWEVGVDYYLVGFLLELSTERLFCKFGHRRRWMWFNVIPIVAL